MDSEQETKTQHVTNLALLQKFFSNDSLSLLSGDTFLDLPIEVRLPNFTFFEHSINDKLASDSKLKIQMNKAVSALKRDEVILNSISEAVV